MLDAAPFQHGFQSVPFLRVDGQPVLHLYRRHAPGEPTLVVLRLPFGRVLGDLLVALQAPGRQRQVIPVAREAAARQPPPRSRRRVLSCQHPPERLNHAQPPAASLKPNHAIGVGPGLGQSFRRRRPPHCAERRVPIRGVTSAAPDVVWHGDGERVAELLVAHRVRQRRALRDGGEQVEPPRSSTSACRVGSRVRRLA